ncbi:MAG: metallopeptidase TldD-related protein, partial [Planctomycetota bacterium]
WVMLEYRAKLQAADGMDLDDVRTYVGLTTEDLPALEKLSVDLDEMCVKLVALSEAPILEEYTGPVLFDPVATGSVLATLLADGLCARPVPLGGGRIVDASLEKKIGLRILPRSFSAYDDPTQQRFDGKVLAGAYDFDDEGVRPRRVDLVEKGIVNKLLAGRAPTKRIHGTTGHARGRGFAEPKANIGCLYVADEQAMPDAELKQEFVQAVKEEGLPHGLRIAALEQGQRGNFGPPRYAYKVDAETGKETLVRGAEFKPVQTRALKRILAAGDKREVYNSLTPVGTSIVAPAVLFEELELARVEREFDRLPALPPPAMRQP